MRRTHPTTALALFALLAAAACALNPREVAKRLDPSVVRIYVIGPQGMGSGTGFVVNREGYVATNFHVVELHTIGESNNPASKDRVDQMGCWTGLTGDPRCYLLN